MKIKILVNNIKKLIKILIKLLYRYNLTPKLISPDKVIINKVQ